MVLNEQEEVKLVVVQRILIEDRWVNLFRWRTGEDHSGRKKHCCLSLVSENLQILELNLEHIYLVRRCLTWWFVGIIGPHCWCLIWNRRFQWQIDCWRYINRWRMTIIWIKTISLPVVDAEWEFDGKAWPGTGDVSDDVSIIVDSSELVFNETSSGGDWASCDWMAPRIVVVDSVSIAWFIWLLLEVDRDGLICAWITLKNVESMLIDTLECERWSATYFM